MPGRPPKPTELLLLTGAARKNPKRMRARADEPQPPKLPVGPPPAKWRCMDAVACHAEMLFREEKSLNDIAAELKITWEEASDLRTRRKHYADWEKLRALWENCLAMWPWVTYSDRDALEDYCRFKLEVDEGRKLSGAELSAMIRIRTELGGTGSGRARLGVKAAGGSTGAPPKATDPRAAFLAQQKYG